MSEKECNKELPFGMGFGCAWMVVEGASQNEIVQTLTRGKTSRCEYRAGLEKVAKADDSDNMIAITGMYKNQNYVIGSTVSHFFYELDSFLKVCREFPRVYVYMTEHVSETHGFALIEYGRPVRFFSYDENNIQNFGDPLPEEIELGYHLPKSFEDVWNEDGNFTRVNEDVIVELATRQVGIDVKKINFWKN